MPTAITTGFDGKVLGKTSYEMTTSDLFNGSGDWENKEGYYPRLTWIRNHPVVSLYTATRGAFTSVDNQTNNTDMFNGNINGTIKIPEELQKNDYSISSSDPSILKVTDGGTIIPVKTGTAEITITYMQPDLSIGGTASNTYSVYYANKSSQFFEHPLMSQVMRILEIHLLSIAIWSIRI
ncbi:MAG: hypothetical protein ACLTDX_08770 [[Clostridium] innocuum]